ncbi:regulatory iron-sulfur-containing complex subunit RicT [uncultured Alistipes sp.]|uniref:regulatory iron-sulfur-containing complex subunit RicT n=1 Tax=uncultured Alistipes sp. TaxID=538949 RepID=UPI00265FF890|nr:regulatory iron-sulfur-containing complex subunit RicT [uncultured Alistipes sp.]
MSCNKKHMPEMGRGCLFCDCGEEVEAIPVEGCFKLHETPWLEEYPDNIPTDIFEVRFKNTRRSYYQNTSGLDLRRGDIVAVEASPGHDIGIVSLTGDMVARQMRRVGFNPFNGEYKKIYRKAKPYDIERWQEAIALEHETMIAARQIASDMGLNMKIGDVEYQGDKIKAIFYYIADERVDFRELIKVFADRFRIRIEMKQIGARQEAGRIGGIGACGRELCCASWISSFSSVTTNAARMQELSLNPQKLAGQCSKLKCCLMYEYDVYADARRGMPRVKEPLQTLDGDYHLIKSDPLARTMSFSSSKDTLANVVTLDIARVKEIIALNRAGRKAETIEGDMPSNQVEEPTYRHAEDSITRFDQKKGRSKRSRRGKDSDRPERRDNASEQPRRQRNGQSDTTDKGGGRNDRRRQNAAEAKPSAEGAESRSGARQEQPQQTAENRSRERSRRNNRDNAAGRQNRQPQNGAENTAQPKPAPADSERRAQGRDNGRDTANEGNREGARENGGEAGRDGIRSRRPQRRRPQRSAAEGQNAGQAEGRAPHNGDKPNNNN